ncbi:hypothetical protein KFU94_31290 [Chloroflexi bacterium TSY]|nr:hypothetical protein [Chloroflexi bacterium TSY]
MKQYRFTLVMLIFAAVLYIVGVQLELDLFERFERWEVDEMLVSVLIVCVGYGADLVTKMYQFEIEQRNRALFNETMRSVLHLLNNFLQSVYLLTFEAKKHDVLNQQKIEHLESLIARTSEQLNKLAKLSRSKFQVLRENSG